MAEFPGRGNTNTSYYLLTQRLVEARNSRMANVPPLPSQPLPRLFLMPVDSQLHQFLLETHRLVQFEPAILERIESDLDTYGLQKKLLREADRRFLEGQTPDLADLRIELRQVDPAKRQLEVGRPRLEPYLVYLFVMLRGRLGGCKDQEARLLQEESITLHWWLENLELSLPAASTLNENLNAVSNATRDFIHKAQLRYILNEGLDDFSSLYLDSTAIKANTERPTESGLITKLVERICRRGGKLDRFGLPNFKPNGLEEVQQEMRRLHREIGFSTGKPKKQGKLKKLYYQLLRRGRRVCKRFERELAAVKNGDEQSKGTGAQSEIDGGGSARVDRCGYSGYRAGRCRWGAQSFGRGESAERGKSDQHQRRRCGLHRQGRMEYDRWISSSSRP